MYRATHGRDRCYCGQVLQVTALSVKGGVDVLRQTLEAAPLSLPTCNHQPRHQSAARNRPRGRLLARSPAVLARHVAVHKHSRPPRRARQQSRDVRVHHFLHSVQGRPEGRGWGGGGWGSRPTAKKWLHAAPPAPLCKPILNNNTVPHCKVARSNGRAQDVCKAWADKTQPQHCILASSNNWLPSYAPCPRPPTFATSVRDPLSYNTTTTTTTTPNQHHKRHHQRHPVLASSTQSPPPPNHPTTATRTTPQATHRLGLLWLQAVHQQQPPLPQLGLQGCRGGGLRRWGEVRVGANGWMRCAARRQRKTRSKQRCEVPQDGAQVVSVSTASNCTTPPS